MYAQFASLDAIDEHKREMERIDKAIRAKWLLHGVDMDAIEAKHKVSKKRKPAQSPSVLFEMTLDEHLDSIQIAWITRALDTTRGRVSEAARLLGLNRTTLEAKMRKFHIVRA